MLPMKLAKRQVDQELFNNVVERLGIKSRLSHKPHEMSGGQQQRVAIGRALVSSAPIVLADEPTGNLDEETTEEIIQILKDVAHKDNKCVIVVTHSDRVAKAADVVYQLKEKTLVKK